MKGNSNKHEVLNFLVSDILADALIQSKGNAKVTHALLDLLLPQMGLDPPDEAGEANPALVSVVDAEQRRFLERIEGRRADGRKRWERWRAKQLAALGVSQRATNAQLTVSTPLARDNPDTDTDSDTDSATPSQDKSCSCVGVAGQPTAHTREGIPKKEKDKARPKDAAEVEAYARTIGYNIDAARFMDCYEEQGWKKKNGLPLMDWKAAVRNWQRRDAEKNPARAAITQTGGAGNDGDF